jgi:hypothetical protein
MPTKLCTWIGKKCAMLRSFRLVRGLCFIETFLLQPSLTHQHKRYFIAGPLGASGRRLQNTLDNLFIVTFKN